jgi:hypothetical protein
MLAGCKTYYITPASLHEQLLSTTPAKAEMVDPFGIHVYFQALQLRTILCTDKAGNPVELAVVPDIEMRVTLNTGKRRTMYFDRTELHGDTLIGHPSWIIPKMEYRILFSSITKVEVQNGGKRMRSVQ